ncbi:MAG: DNA repair protein RadC [Deltaproteobacteria bacterium]|nr:DNA repair protein RadC [Deltaproteobacteria bacterium]
MRPREHYRHEGPARFGDAELLALVVGTGTADRSALEIGAALLSHFGGLPALAGAQVADLQRQPGLGLARAVRVHAALELGRRSLHAPGDPSHPIRSPADAHAHLGPALRGRPDEELHALYLDRRHRPRAHRMLTRGSDGFTVVDPRQVFRPAVSLGAFAVVLAHNHPSGDPTPSAQDREVTRRVAAAGRILGIALLDHLVVGDGDYVSLAEQGELPAWDRAQVAGVAA